MHGFETVGKHKKHNGFRHIARGCVNHAIKAINLVPIGFNKPSVASCPFDLPVNSALHFRASLFVDALT